MGALLDEEVRRGGLALRDRLARQPSLLRALELDPTIGSAHNSLGVAFALTGRPPRAVEEFGIAARLSPTPDILANLERARGAAARRQP